MQFHYAVVSHGNATAVKRSRWWKRQDAHVATNRSESRDFSRYFFKNSFNDPASGEVEVTQPRSRRQRTRIRSCPKVNESRWASCKRGVEGTTSTYSPRWREFDEDPSNRGRRASARFVSDSNHCTCKTLSSTEKYRFMTAPDKRDKNDRTSLIQTAAKPKYRQLHRWVFMVMGIGYTCFFKFYIFIDCCFA